MKKLHVEDGACFREARIEEVLEAARAALALKVGRGAQLTCPRVAGDYLATRFGYLDHEVFSVLFLDSLNRLIECVEMFRGTMDGTTIHSREVVKEALQRNAAAVILCHNHPSGVAEPSIADHLITGRLRDALSVVDVRLMDHLIVAGGSVISMAERGEI